MSFAIGLDIGGTKIAGAVFDKNGTEIAQQTLATPADYAALLESCASIVTALDNITGEKASVGIGVPGVIDRERDFVYASNLLCLRDRPFIRDIDKKLGRTVALGNDANCAALSEAVDGAGAQYHMIFGVVMGTGAGGGLVIDKRVIEGPNGLTGEWGHMPLPFREEADGPALLCACGQHGCIEQHISGPALSRLHERMTGHALDAAKIGALAVSRDAAALKTLDHFYTTVAKAMVTIIHTIDPQVVVISGGLSELPGLYDKVPERWGEYALRKDLKTALRPAKHGARTGLRGAAWLGKRP